MMNTPLLPLALAPLSLSGSSDGTAGRFSGNVPCIACNGGASHGEQRRIRDGIDRSVRADYGWRVSLAQTRCQHHGLRQRVGRQVPAVELARIAKKLMRPAGSNT